MNFTMDFTTISLIVLIIIVLALIAYIAHLNNKLNNFLIGSGTKNLDESLSSINSSIDELKNFRIELEKYLTTAEKRLKKSVQAVHTVRFNPFKGTGGGGNQSFATAFLNEEGDGVIISSLYSREHVSVYSKPIKNSASEYELSQEEKEALGNAKLTFK